MARLVIDIPNSIAVTHLSVYGHCCKSYLVPCSHFDFVRCVELKTRTEHVERIDLSEYLDV